MQLTGTHTGISLYLYAKSNDTRKIAWVYTL